MLEIIRSAQTRGRSRAAVTSKMECFVVIVNGFQPLTIITRHSILDVAAALDSPLVTDVFILSLDNYFRFLFWKTLFQKSRRSLWNFDNSVIKISKFWKLQGGFCHCEIDTCEFIWFYEFENSSILSFSDYLLKPPSRTRLP